MSMPLVSEAKGQSESVCRTIKSITVFKLFNGIIHLYSSFRRHEQTQQQSDATFLLERMKEQILRRPLLSVR